MPRAWSLVVIGLGGFALASCGDNVEPRLLIATIAVAPGAQCPTGGTEIEVGQDRNNDGVLQPDEVESTTYVCNPANPTTIEGSFVVENSEDASKLLGVTSITGDLTIDANGLSTLDLSSLQSIGGLLEIAAFSGTALHFDALTSVDTLEVRVAVETFTAPHLAHVNAMLFYQTQLPSLAFAQLFPGLTQLPIGLGIDANEALTALDLSSLTSIGGLTIDSNDGLPTVAMSGVHTLESIEMQGNTTLSTIDASALATAAAIDIENDNALTSISLPALATSQLGITLANLPAMTTVSLPALAHTGALEIANDPVLTTLDLSTLSGVDASLVIEDDQTLASLALPELRSAATAAPDGGVDPQIAIESDAVLATISAPLWTAFGAAGQSYLFAIASDPELPTCAATALAQQVGATNTQLTGDSSATCP